VPATTLSTTYTARSRAISSLVLSLGFSFTGAGTIMLGVILPVLSQKWTLPDDQAGMLFFLQFLGSSLGAVFTGLNRVRALLLGYGLLVVSALALAFSGRNALFSSFFFFGLGLGMAMTATSLFISDRYGDDRAPQLERLNFAWSAGAGAAPLLFLPFLHGVSLRLLFFIVLAAFLLVFFWVLLRERQPISIAATSTNPSQHSQSTLVSMLPLVILATCAVGVESSLGGWLTTYSDRAAPHAASRGALATSFFMFGIMISRLIFSTRLLAAIGRHRILRITLWATAASAALLIASRHASIVSLAAALAGISIGPLYPLLLSFLLERSPRGWIFAVAGLGSAIFPWLTGLLSAHLNSLRYGLAAPCAAALFMILLGPAAAPRTPARNLPASA
jgi:MFS transporter, FHS family, glucose/mannose:H+ symporter